MEQESVQRAIDQADSDLLQLSDTIAVLKDSLNALIEENNQLRLTNQELRDLLLERSQSEDVTHGVAPTDDATVTGKERLQSFYDEGIHICHPFFGTRIIKGDECLFCQDILNKLDEADDVN